MNVAYLCVLASALFPYFLVAYAKASSRYLKEGNQEPRRYAETLSGPRKRAYWAHLNAFEAFPPFAAAVIIASIAGVDQSTINNLSVAFIVCRAAHGILYIVDFARLRSAVWMAGMACICVLLVMAASA